jgi:anthranilate synthase component 1
VSAALEHDLASDVIEAVAAPGSEALLPAIEQLARAAAADQPAAQDFSRGVASMRIEEEPPERFLERVAQAQEHIRAGDIYQANLSRWWRAPLPEGDAYALYERLCAANPAPFAAFARLRGMDILSSSPERLLQVAAREASTRPIAGTRPRSRVPGEDSTEAAALTAHPKERAEHVMLIDLERNDLGRICKPGSVRVDEFMVVESYAHVHHIVSNVRGTLRDEVTAVDALRAVFPGGTITGVPKVRCMEIIAALEGAGRDAYTGSLGWIATNGDADFNILIRTLTLADGRIEARAGAGIVADSEAGRELEETRAKARGLLAALVDI